MAWALVRADCLCEESVANRRVTSAWSCGTRRFQKPAAGSRSMADPATFGPAVLGRSKTFFDEIRQEVTLSTAASSETIRFVAAQLSVVFLACFGCVLLYGM